jgi:hypothetical protein
MESINVSENEMTEKWVKSNPLLAIQKLPKQALPIDWLLEHSDKSPTELEVITDEMLAKYKHSLANDYLLGNLNIQELILLLKSK